MEENVSNKWAWGAVLLHHDNGTSEEVEITSILKFNHKEGRVITVLQHALGNYIIQVDNDPESGRVKTSMHLTEDSALAVLVTLQAYFNGRKDFNISERLIKLMEEGPASYMCSDDLKPYQQ